MSRERGFAKDRGPGPSTKGTRLWPPSVVLILELLIGKGTSRGIILDKKLGFHGSSKTNQLQLSSALRTKEKESG